jgi:pimeloyl-ACP methyl ester carboxylesterase
MDVTSRGYRIHYLTFGDAEPAIVLLHGHLQAAEDWVTNGYPELLTPTHRVIAIDLLGYGDSDRPHDVTAHLLDGRVEDVAAVLDAQGIDRATVWGYSMGVSTAEAFAKQHPDRTTALVSVGNLVGASAEDRHNLSFDAAEKLARVGVRSYVETDFPFVTAETADLFATRNDALAASAAAKAICMPHAADDAALPEATLNYMGTDEPWFELVKAVAGEKGVAFEAVPGDHAGAFQGAELATEIVVRFVSDL